MLDDDRTLADHLVAIPQYRDGRRRPQLGQLGAVEIALLLKDVVGDAQLVERDQDLLAVEREGVLIEGEHRSALLPATVHQCADLHAPMLGVVRLDVNVAQVIPVVIGIATTPASEPGQVEHRSRGATSRGEALSRQTARLNTSGPLEERAGPCAHEGGGCALLLLRRR